MFGRPIHLFVYSKSQAIDYEGYELFAAFLGKDTFIYTLIMIYIF